MENILSLNEEVELIIKKKFPVCKSDPCICSEDIRRICYEELKDVLARFNQEYLVTHPTRIRFINQSINPSSIIYYWNFFDFISEVQEALISCLSGFWYSSVYNADHKQ